MTTRPGYKDFPKGDTRRYFTALLAVVRLKDRATIHYISQDIGCSRAEAQKALEAVSTQCGVEFERTGPVYQVTSWGVIKKTELVKFLEGED